MGSIAWRSEPKNLWPPRQRVSTLGSRPLKVPTAGSAADPVRQPQCPPSSVVPGGDLRRVPGQEPNSARMP